MTDDRIFLVCMIIFFIICGILALIIEKDDKNLPFGVRIFSVLVLTAFASSAMYGVQVNHEIIEALRDGKKKYIRTYTLENTIQDGVLIKSDTTWDWKLIDNK